MTDIVEIWQCDELTKKEVKVGDQIKLFLEANPSTGYSWQIITLDEELLIQVGEEKFIAESSNIGSKGKIEFTFNALKFGDTKLELQYSRTWAPNKDDRIFSVDLAVHPNDIENQ